MRPASWPLCRRGGLDRIANRCIIGRMTIASPAVRGAKRPLVTSAVPTAADAPEDLRDQLTRGRLLATVDHLPGIVVEGFDRNWWDGQVRVASVVVRAGRRMRRMRVVETNGDCVVVPFSRRLAHRWLAARRRPKFGELNAAVAQRDVQNVVVDGWNDAVRCATRGCGALRPVGYPGCCPVCGG